MDADQPFVVLRSQPGIKDVASQAPREPPRMSAQHRSQEGDSSNNRKWSALACAAVCGAATVRRTKRTQKRPVVSRQVYKVEIDVPDPKEVEKEIETIAGPTIAKDLQQIGRAASEMLHSAEKALPKVTLPSLPKGMFPEVPPELTAAAKQLASKVEAAVGPNLTDLSKLAATHLPPDIAKVLLHPQVLEPAMMPAGVGAFVVWLLALRRGPQPWLEELPREYDYGRITAYWQRRPFKLLTRFVEAGIKVGGFLFALKTDEWTGAEDKMRPQRAIEARELITDLGVTFIKIAQVWASRPDILPKEYLKEYEKLLEQVRPFGRDLALETLRRSVDGSKAAIDLFDDLSVFEKPIASASVGQVYKAELYGKTVAVKVQRPDVRDQSTLDLYVIRTAGSIGSLLPWPFLSTARQSKQLVELIDLTAPTFIQELDYEVEAENQRRFAKTVEDCELIKDAVAVPDIVFANREVLVQEWLDGKKLTEPGAAQEQAGRVVKLLLNSYMVQFLETGYLHGDPHPGNFILMGDGRLGILDYGLMTEISGEKRLAFIEFLMHLQAKEYKSCLNDLINLEFFPPALAADKEALDIIVPTLANTLSTLYEEGGDLKKKREMFAKQREEMKAAGKLDGLREKLQAISKKYSGAFRLPPYFTLILRAFGTLEGLGLKTNENFAIVKECFPYIARRLITDDSFRMREALRSYLYKGRSRIAVSRIDELATGFGNFTNLMKGSRTESAAAGGIQMEQNGQNGTHEQSNGQSNGRVREVDSATREIAEVVFSPDGNFLQDLLIEEGVAAIDALSRASLVRLLRTLGPLALPLALPLNFLLGGADDQQLLSREDKQSLLVLRRITELVDAGRRPAAETDEAADFGETVRSLQRLQPIAQGLLPSITPGAASFAGRFARQLARRVLLRLADDVERRANNALL
eukprot:CAMPEP_0181426384 /NCGR_PEP_ID=MMETSP1110-20121109/15635_1 /TAXON_ID=174948 /ORGANISM="Symbiodinium sp., Strain CCMP421" /LENGTH=922 /DNA_ID=CAMNT_0023549577 /DNA_START=104 /DNA_END=2868 /DNA_ORIENTATION=+